MKTCASCKREITDDYVKFKCPACGKETINRCKKCRENVLNYTCKCGFVGP